MTLTDFNYFLLLRLLVAALLGGLIGLERGRKRHEAGLRTHIVLCLGAASVMLTSECIVKQYGSGDIMRMGAQVISGIGFLGVGSMIIDGNKVRGVTTAAGLWTTACVGLAVGIGYYIVAAATVLIMLFAMLGLGSISARLELNASRACNIKISVSDRSAIRQLMKMLEGEGIEVNSVKLEDNKDDILVVFEVRLQAKNSWNTILDEVMTIEGVRECIAGEFSSVAMSENSQDISDKQGAAPIT